MHTGAINGYIDVAQLTLYAFWIFFAGLIWYLRREDKREGYPLESDRSERAPRVKLQGYPAIPSPKTFKLADGRTVQTPRAEKASGTGAARPVAPWPGAPLEPTGNPMLDAVGPASYADRDDAPDILVDGTIMIVPLRAAPGFGISSRDPDPRGFAVLGCDGNVGGEITDVWVDRAEPQIRYLELRIAGGTTRLLPITLAKIDGSRRRVNVLSITAAQFAGVPAIRSPDSVTRREEDRITAYYSSGHLYATPDRLGPVL